MPGNYQPRGTSQTTTNASWYYVPTAGDTALLQQNAAYELLSQKFVGSIEVIQDGKDVTVQSQNKLLAINIQMTSDSARAYQPTVTLVGQPYYTSLTAPYWSIGITDWLATYNAQVAYAKAQGWN
jgi:hypothetical protein